MRLYLSARFLKSYQDAPQPVQKAFQKQARLLIANLRHPSLHTKKYDEGGDIWQARVNREWRFYFSIEADQYRLHDITRHPK